MKSKFCPHCGGELPEKDERSWRQIIGVDNDTLFGIVIVIAVAVVLIVLAATDKT